MHIYRDLLLLAFANGRTTPHQELERARDGMRSTSPLLPTPGNPSEEQFAKALKLLASSQRKDVCQEPSVSTQTEEGTESVWRSARPSIAQSLSRHSLQRQLHETQ